MHQEQGTARYTVGVTVIAALARILSKYNVDLDFRSHHEVLRTGQKDVFDSKFERGSPVRKTTISFILTGN